VSAHRSLSLFSLSLSLSISLSAASSFSFCRSSLEHTLSVEELSFQLPRRVGGGRGGGGGAGGGGGGAGGSNLTWHDGHGQRTTEHTRTVKLLQQPGTEGIQVERERERERLVSL